MDTSQVLTKFGLGTIYTEDGEAVGSGSLAEAITSTGPFRGLIRYVAEHWESHRFLRSMAKGAPEARKRLAAYIEERDDIAKSLQERAVAAYYADRIEHMLSMFHGAIVENGVPLWAHRFDDVRLREYDGTWYVLLIADRGEEENLVAAALHDDDGKLRVIADITTAEWFELASGVEDEDIARHRAERKALRQAEFAAMTPEERVAYGAEQERMRQLQRQHLQEVASRASNCEVTG